MGVTGLWSVLDAELAGQTVNNYQSLRGQRIAIDASIWLYQLSRVSTKNALSQTAFIAAGLFRRLAKLCHFGILPVFVFDGMPPLLKREELRRRLRGREKGEVDVKRIAERILRARLKLLAAGAGADVVGKVFTSVDNGNEEDMFKLKPMAPAGDSDQEYQEYQEYSSEEEYSDSENGEDAFKNIDINSPSFKRLPEDAQLELLYQLKERLLQSSSLSTKTSDPRELTNAQIEAIKKRHAITASIDRLKRGLTWSNLDGDLLVNGGSVAKARRIASSDRKAFVLVKNEGHGYTFAPTSHPQQVVAEKVDGGGDEKDSEDEFMAEFFSESQSVALPPLAVKMEYTNLTVPKATTTETILIESEEEKVVSTLVESEEKESVPTVIKPKEAKEEEKIPWKKEGAQILDTSPVILEPKSATPAMEMATKTLPAKPVEPASQESSNLQPLQTAKETIDNGTIILDLQRELLDLQQEHAKKSLQTESMSSEQEQLFRDFLDACGFPWMVAISEAEAQCANLYLTGSVDGIITDDVDVFLFGGDNVYRHFFKNKTAPLIYRLQDRISYTRDDLIILALLLGGDYGPGLTGYGPKKATALISMQTVEERHRNVHDRVSSLRLTLPPQPDVERALSDDIVNAYLNPAVDTVHYDRLRWGAIDKKRLRELLKRQAGWKEFEIDQSLNNLVKL